MQLRAYQNIGKLTVKYATCRYWADQCGSFQVMPSDGGRQGNSLRQVFTYIMIAMIARMSDDLGTHPHTYAAQPRLPHPAAFPLLQRMMM